jgi:hypothetical protein
MKFIMAKYGKTFYKIGQNDKRKHNSREGYAASCAPKTGESCLTLKIARVQIKDGKS